MAHLFSQTEDLAQLARSDKFVSSQLRRVKIAKAIGRQKKFLRSYHEIRFHIEKPSYIPNFDTYTREQKAQITALLTDKSEAEVGARDAQLIDEQFEKLIAREVADLEADVLAAMS